MRDKIYLAVISGIFLLLLIWSPTAFVLEKTGLIELEDLANYKDPEVYEEDVLFAGLLNKIEEGKASLENIYTNYLPFYAELLRFTSFASGNIQDEFVYMLWNRANKPAASVAQTPEPDISNMPALSDSDDTEPAPEPEPEPQTPQFNFIANKIADAGMFRVYRVRSADGDDSMGFLDISMAMPHRTAANNMLDEQRHINRIAAANKSVNFFVYIATRMQDTAYYNEIISTEPSTNDIFNDFINGISDNVAGIAWFDIDTLEKRMNLCFKTDHHWNALGAYQGYTEIINMMNKIIPEIGSPLPLKGLIEFPNVEYRGSGAGRTNTPVYYDNFAVMDIDLPAQHPTERVTSKLGEYQRGRWDIDRLGRNDYTSHYENFYNTPNIITYPENNTNRRLLILGDSYVYWVSWLIGANFDKTFVHYTLWEQDLDYNKFIRDNNITDVLLLQYSARTLSKATSASKYLEQVITN